MNVGLRLTILSPVYNDWLCARQLLAELAAMKDNLPGRNTSVRVVLVDDGSPAPCPADLTAEINPQRIESVDVVRLARNVGHQRAIALGLCYCSERVACDLLVVMDCDGEDRPGDVPRLVAAALKDEQGRIVFAARARRSEGLVFRAGYLSYRYLHRVLTGVSVRFGNFSVMPSAALHSLPLVSETWNHYAAAIVKARIPFTMLQTDRGTRYAGSSTMNVVSLTMHGISAMSVFAEVISVRLLMMTLAAGTVAGIGFGLGLALYPSTPLVVAALAVAAVVFVTALVTSVFMLGIHAVRGSASFLPKRDYRLFIESSASLDVGPVGAPGQQAAIPIEQR